MTRKKTLAICLMRTSIIVLLMILSIDTLKKTNELLGPI